MGDAASQIKGSPTRGCISGFAEALCPGLECGLQPVVCSTIEAAYGLKAALQTGWLPNEREAASPGRPEPPHSKLPLPSGEGWGEGPPGRARGELASLPLFPGSLTLALSQGEREPVVRCSEAIHAAMGPGRGDMNLSSQQAPSPFGRGVG